jgi:amino acid adenylation domain-containing protein
MGGFMTKTDLYHDAAIGQPAPSPTAPIGDRHLATSWQQQVWLAEQVVGDSTQHHVVLSADITGPLDVEALRRALQTVVNRHDGLRTVLVPVDGVLCQQVVSGGSRFAIYDLEETAPAERAARLADMDAEQLARPFDLGTGPLIRTSVAILGPEESRLLVVTHRAAADEASLRVFVRELLECYGVLARRARPDLPAPRQFSDHTAGGAAVSAADQDYWREALASLPGPLELPFAVARDTTVALDTTTATFQLPEQVVTRLRALAEAERTSVDTLMLAAFTVLLHRYTRGRDIVLGTWTRRREAGVASGDSGVIGPIDEPTVLRLRVPFDPTWREAVQQVRDTLETATVHQAATFADLVALARPQRELNLHPVFQIFAAPAPGATGTHTVDEVSFAFTAGDGGQSPYDLELRTTPDGGYLRCRADLFAPEHGATMVGHLSTLLAQLVEHPDAHLSDLSLLSPDEFDLIVRQWNQTVTDFPRDRSIQSLFESWADLTPDAPALHWEDVSLTYRELEAQANRLAHYLRGLGVGAETAVGLYLGYTADWVIGALATLKAGGLYVPLEPSYPADRLAAMCTDSDIKVLLMRGDMDDQLTYDGAKRVRMDAEAATIASQPASRVEIDIDPDRLAYIMFTSGSTGRAKAIGVTHRNVIRTVCNTPYVDFRAIDTVGQASNISFDAATFELWGALLNGSRLVGLRKEDVLDPERLTAKLQHHGISIFFLPAALMKQIVAQKPDAFGSLRYFFSGGEQADLHTVRRLLQHGAPEHFVNPYGPTETTVFAIVYRCNDMVEDETHVPIGFPIGNTTSYVLDPYLQPVPVGVAGELFVGGDGVARGYVGQSDMTADKFIADPFADDPSARLYRTGDLGRYRPDGMIDFLGRIDRQVKVRGFRVEPDEIETCVLGSGLVSEVSVQVGHDRSGDQVLVAYVVPAVDGLDPERIRDHVRGRLPVYMVPSAVVSLPSLPLNANGKLDSVALQRVMPVAGAGATDAPLTGVQRRLLDIWSGVLGATGLGVHDDLFLAGADSLAVGRAVWRMRAELGVEVAFRLPFERPTVAGLSEAVEALVPADRPDDVDTVPAQPAEGATTPATATSLALTDQLLAIWRDVLEVPTLGPDDDFFLNGGHSLKVTRVVSRVNAALNRDVPVRLLFDHRTVVAYAAAIEALGSGPAPAAQPELVRVEDTSDIDALLDQIEKLSGEDPDGNLAFGSEESR